MMGNDQSVVQAARVSYGEGTKHTSNDRSLIRYLMRHRHTTPFEMVELKFLVRAPMDTWRQWIRHRTANVNEYSTRYSVAIDSAQKTQLDEWRLQSGSNKQGSEGGAVEWPEGYAVISAQMSEEEPKYLVTTGLDTCDDSDKPRYAPIYGDYYLDQPSPSEHLSKQEQHAQKILRDIYEERLLFGVAREQARKDLPLSTYTEAYWKIDLHNLLHFLSLRMDSHAQKEIRDYATIMGQEIVRPLLPLVWEAFEDYRLGAMFLTRLEVEYIQRLLEQIGGWEEDTALAEQDESWVALKQCRERDEALTKLRRLGFLKEDSDMSEWVRLERLPHNDLPKPAYATDLSAGLDLAACLTRECKEVRGSEKAPFVIDRHGKRWYGAAMADAEIDPEAKTMRLYVQPQEVVMVPLGFKSEFGEDHVLHLHVRSSVGIKGLMLANGTGIVDPDYRGELFAVLYNRTNTAIAIDHGQRIVQGVLTKFTKAIVTEGAVNDTSRGEKGFGSTGTGVTDEVEMQVKSV